MASQLLGIKTRFTNDLGSPLVGGQVYTYFAGTSTNQDTYSDAALTVPNTNPVILDDTGSADIFLKGSYRIRVFDKSGRFIEEQDNVTQAASQGDATEIGERIDAIQIDVSAQKLDTGITATPQGVGMVARTQAQVNAETVSLLDFGAPYSTDSSTHLQAAFDYLNNVGGGVLTIPHHTGVLKLSSAIQLYSNIVVLCDDNLLIDCDDSSASYMFNLSGSVDTEFNLTANATIGDTTLNFSGSLVVNPNNHLLLVSQRECAHADAGELWLLGETTASTASPHFAEVVVVDEVLSQGSIKVQTPLLFPDYNTNNTQENSPSARASSTVQLINFETGFKWFGGVFKRDTGGIFNFEWTKDCEVATTFKRGYGTGYEVLNRYSYSNRIKAKASRPSDWEMLEAHQRYNSVKDISSWFTYVELDEEGGSQGLDQTYSKYPSIFPVYRLRATNSLEGAMTTHGNCYGADITINAVNCRNYVYHGRSRFSTVRVKALNCHGGVICSVAGALDCTYDLDLLNMYSVGFRINSGGNTRQTPARKNTRVSGRIVMSPLASSSAVWFEANTDTVNNLVDSGIVLSDLHIRSTSRSISIFDYINGVTFNNVIIDYHGEGAPVYLQSNSGHNLTNFKVNMRKNAGLAILSSLLPTANERVAYGATPLNIDYKTCKVTNGELIKNDARLASQSITLNGTASNTSSYNIANHNITDHYSLNVLQGSTDNNRLVLENSIPIGRTFQIYVTGLAGTSFGVYALDGGTLNFLNNSLDIPPRYIDTSTPKLIHIHKYANNSFNIF